MFKYQIYTHKPTCKNMKQSFTATLHTKPFNSFNFAAARRRPWAYWWTSILQHGCSISKIVLSPGSDTQISYIAIWFRRSRLWPQTPILKCTSFAIRFQKSILLTQTLITTYLLPLGLRSRRFQRDSLPNYRRFFSLLFFISLGFGGIFKGKTLPYFVLPKLRFHY